MHGRLYVLFPFFLCCCLLMNGGLYVLLSIFLVDVFQILVNVVGMSY